MTYAYTTVTCANTCDTHSTVIQMSAARETSYAYTTVTCANTCAITSNADQMRVRFTTGRCHATSPSRGHDALQHCVVQRVRLAADVSTLLVRMLLQLELALLCCALLSSVDLLDAEHGRCRHLPRVARWVQLCARHRNRCECARRAACGMRRGRAHRGFRQQRLRLLRAVLVVDVFDRLLDEAAQPL